MGRTFLLLFLLLGAALAAESTVPLTAIPVAPSAALVTAPMVEDFALIDLTGRSRRLSRQTDVPYLVVAIFTTGCPIVRQQTPALEAIARDYAGRARVWWLAPGGDTPTELAAEVRELGITQPLLPDPTQLVGRLLGATRSAEVLVIATADRSIRWRGPLDDRAGYGIQRASATREWLREALDALLAGGQPPADSPTAKGCRLTYAPLPAPEYARDVAPILLRSCVDCHRAGGIAPFALGSAPQAVKRAAMIGEVVMANRMPPWPADPAIGSFAGGHALSVDEQRVLVTWAADPRVAPGMPDPLSVAAAARTDDGGWPLGPPDLVVELGAQDIPATGTLPYRTGTVHVPLAGDRWLRAMDLRPSDPRVLHHGFVFNAVADPDDLPPDLPAALRARLVAMDPGQLAAIRHSFFGDRLRGAGTGAAGQNGLTTFLASYVPGLQPQSYPSDTGRLLKGGGDLRYQLHYTTIGTAVTDHPRLGLYFTTTPPARVLRITSAFDLRLAIPPGAHDHPAAAVRTFPAAVDLFGVSPHMHLRGDRMRFTAAYPDGRREVLLSVPEYQLDWQMSYRFAEPKRLPAGTCVLVEGAFDNSPQNPRNPDPTVTVRFGEQTGDEMFIGYLVYALAP